MANHDLVFPYVSELQVELSQMGFPCPAVWAGNRFPTKREIQHAIVTQMNLALRDAEDDSFLAVRSDATDGAWELDVECNDWDHLGTSPTDSITIRGKFKAELQLLTLHARNCGQLVLHPDTGNPPVIVDSRMDVEKTSELWWEATKRETDSWEFLFEQLYSH